jgi:glycosyltransferase involved in cell wall biosynthesis
VAKKNLLVIPHTSLLPNLVTRGEALARGLASEFDVFLLSWRSGAIHEPSVSARVASRLGGLFTSERVFRRANITVIEVPFIYVRRSGLGLVRAVNTWIVNRAVRKHGIDLVINQLALVNSKNLNVPHIIDIVDLPSPAEITRWSRQAKGAAGITTITAGITEELAAHGMDAEVIPNGADFERFRLADGGKTRAEFGLGGRFVVGYIGNHAEWSGLLFLLDVFKGVKAVIPGASLLVVGMGSEIPKAKAKVAREDIRDVLFTGPVNVAGVADYFKAIDVGVLPFELDPHAALSFPIKVIEYGAAHKIVVASPLRVLKEIELPNVRIVDRDVGGWTEAIIRTRDAEWDPAWDGHVEAYDWRNISTRLASYVKSRIPT